MAVNFKEAFGKFAKEMEPVGTVLKVLGAGFTCITAGIGTFMKCRELWNAAKSAKDGEVIDPEKLGDNDDEQRKPITPEEYDEIFGENKEEVE